MFNSTKKYEKRLSLSTFPMAAEFGYFTLLFCRGWQGNLSKIIRTCTAIVLLINVLFHDVLVAVAVVVFLRSLIIPAGRLIMTRMLKTRTVFTHWADSNTRDRQHCPLWKLKHCKLKNEKMERSHLKPKPTLPSQQVCDESRYTTTG